MCSTSRSNTLKLHKYTTPHPDPRSIKKVDPSERLLDIAKLQYGAPHWGSGIWVVLCLLAMISNHPRLVVFECHPSIAINSFSMILRAPDACAATWHSG